MTVQDSTNNKDLQHQAMIDTLAHINTVFKLLNNISQILIGRAMTHDHTKLEEPELSLFAKWGPKLKQLEYGSDAYKEALKNMGEALKHHYDNNRHHPEHFKNGIDDMDLIDLIEMVCDWKAATLRMKEGDFSKSLEYNQKRFKMNPQLVKIIKNSERFLM